MTRAKANSTGPDQQWALERWMAKYSQRGKPKWRRKEMVQLSELSKLLGADFRATWANYLKDDTPYTRGHSPAKLHLDPERWRMSAPIAPEARPPNSTTARAYREAWERHEARQGARRAEERRRQDILAEVRRENRVSEWGWAFMRRRKTQLYKDIKAEADRRYEELHGPT